jgi:hypothetical protein
VAGQFCIRSFTGRGAFDETLPVEDGKVEIGRRVDASALRTDMEDWFTRKFGEGKVVKLVLTEEEQTQAVGSRDQT